MDFNFKFLKDHTNYSDFSDACIEAEKSLSLSYSSTAILARRALELAVKWVYSHDDELSVPYQDNLASLIHEYTFKSVIDTRLFPMILFILKLGNNAVHTNTKITRGQAVLALRNLYEFITWIDYCYSDDIHDKPFDESLLADGQEVSRTKKELEDLYERLGSKDRKLEEVMKENESLRKANAEKRKERKVVRDFKVDDISEYETRKNYIDLEIQIAGWEIGKDCLEEVEVQGMPNPRGVGYADYVLYGDDGKPLAVIEAKKTSVNQKEGQTQAKLYADCLEKQYGRRPLIFYTNGFTYEFWDDLHYPNRYVAGIYTKDDLEWLMYKRNHKKSLKNPEINDHITDRPYQKLGITAVCEALEEGHRKSLLVMATGSGKTRTAISLVDVLTKNNWVKNVLFLADRIALVKQAKKNFKALLPDLSLCNLLDSKENPESRMVFSTYKTMMNAIDEKTSKDGKRIFTTGHFDLIIVDESHRSIYKKYQDIFKYFDGILLGLTATPKSDIDKNTYEIFELEDNVPTFAYELDEAIEEDYLVPYHTIETKLKLMEEGIHYDELSEDQKEHFEEIFDDDVTDISPDELNSKLFNTPTVEMVLEDVMEKGIKVEGGDKLGKTIMFAKNKKHAEFIVEVFNAMYPSHKNHYAKEVYDGIKYIETVIDDFSSKEKLPQIAVSVDMLDTGIDIPEIVNLVFFKKVRSKTKFWQMIGRGTRKCQDLFGIGLDKTEFRIFDYCSNFEFFRIDKNGKEAKLVKTLTENLFGIKLKIVAEMQKLKYQEERYIRYRNALVKELYQSVVHIDENKFSARLAIQYLDKYKQEKEWKDIHEHKMDELEKHIAPLLEPIKDGELAKRFDFLMLSIEYCELAGASATKQKQKVVRTAEKLTEKGNMSQVREYEELIFKVQTEVFWEEADIFDYELVREAFRDLIRLIQYEAGEIYYTNFKEEVIQQVSSTYEETEHEFVINDLKSYRKKVNQYLKDQKDDMVVYKLRNNLELTKDDVKHLEKILWNELGSKEDYIKEYGEEPLLKLVSSIVGLEMSVANQIFSEFINDESLNSNQIDFLKMIVNFVVKNGILDKNLLNDHPFTKYGNVIQLFEGKKDTALKIIDRIDKLNSRVDIS
jgi:type I restriction enzyme R subunit